MGTKDIKKNVNMELEAQDAEFERLYECPEGCGRSFRRDALEKHIKVCKSVFQKKKDAIAKRGASLAINKNKDSKVDASVDPLRDRGEQTKQWKKESENFRNMIKGKAPNREDQLAEISLPEKVCDICSKHFTDQSYIRHRPICESKKKFMERGK